MFNYSTSSGVKTASSQILSARGGLCGVDTTAPSSGSSVLTIYDSENSTTSGKLVLAEMHLDAGLASLNHEYVVPVGANRGIYCVLTSTGAGTTYVVRTYPG
jgi:hypothetical protein